MDHATTPPIWLPRVRAVLIVLCSNLMAIVLLGLFLLSAVYAAESDPIGSPEEARRWWLEAAEQGQPDMQYGLARMYETGAPTLGIAADAQLAGQPGRHRLLLRHGRCHDALVREGAVMKFTTTTYHIVFGVLGLILGGSLTRIGFADSPRCTRGSRSSICACS